MHKVQDKPETAKQVLKFFDWAYTDGGNAASELGYVPLPDEVQQRTRETWITQVRNDGATTTATVARK